MQITEQSLRDIENTIKGFRKSIPIFYSKMVPKYLFNVKNDRSHVALEALHDATVLCVSAIGSAEAFVKSIGKVSCFVQICFFDNKDSVFAMLINRLYML